MANKNTLRLRRAGFAGYGEKRGSKVDTSLNNPDRKSSRKTFKIRPIEFLATSEKDESKSNHKTQKSKRTDKS